MPESNRLFATGGSSDDFNKTCYELKTSATGSTYTAEKKTDMTFKREFHSMCYLNDKLFFVSGSRNTESGADRSVESYNVESGNWAQMADLPQGRSRHSSCGFADRYILLFGGMCGRLRVNSILRMDTQV